MKSFHFDGPTWAFLTPDQMYDEEGKLRKAHKHYENADIYFLAIMNKCLFVPGKTRIARNGNIICRILVGDPVKKKFNRIRLEFSLAETLYTMPGIVDKFKSRDEFVFSVLLRQYRPKSEYKKKLYISLIRLLNSGILSAKVAFRALRAIYASEITIRHVNRFEINIYDPLADAITNNEKAERARKANPRFYNLNEAAWNSEKLKDVDYDKLPGPKENGSYILRIDQVISLSGMDVGNQRIAYIGKTEQEPFDRLFPHEKLNKLDAKLLRNEFETLIIHLFGFKNWDSPVLSLPPTTSIKRSDAITIAEAGLINYFKPPENHDYVSDNGRAEWKHIKLLKRMGYGKVRGLLDVDGQYSKFYTDHIGDQRPNRHEIDVELSSIK